MINCFDDLKKTSNIQKPDNNKFNNIIAGLKDMGLISK